MTYKAKWPMIAGEGIIPNLFRLHRSQRLGPIGLELAAEQLHMLQMEQLEDNSLRIRAAVSIPYPGERDSFVADPQRLKPFLRQALKSKPFQGTRVITCLPSDNVKILSFTYRLNPGQGEGEAIMKGVKERLGDDWGEMVVDYLPVRKMDNDKGERAALVTVARRAAVISHLEMLRKAGLTVEALEVGPVAIKRLVACMNEGNTHESVLVVNFGRSKSYLTVIWGQRLILDRELDFGEERVIAKVSQELEITAESASQLLYRHGVVVHPEHAATGGTMNGDPGISETLVEILKPAFLTLVEHINKVGMYVASETHGEFLQRIYLLGSIARWPGADKFMNSLIAIPVQSLNPFSAFLARSDAAVLAELDPIAGIALATGLALRGMQTNG